MRIKKPEVHRFFRKGQYKTLDKGLLHKFLKEEGYSRYGLALDLDVTSMTIDRYMDNPEKMKIKHIKILCEETGVDANFIMDLIY